MQSAPLEGLNVFHGQKASLAANALEDLEFAIARHLLTTNLFLVSGPVLRKSDRYPRGEDFCQVPHGPRVIPRDGLLDILHTHVDAGRCQIKTNKKLRSYIQDKSGKVTLSFEDNTQFETDVLIGADGVHSRVRQHMFLGDHILSAPQFSGQFAYRMSCSRAEVEKRCPNSIALRGFRIVRRRPNCDNVWN
ncbi:FAD/NAD(P)-binding domain-containing protein [Alternaria alternata]|nr:FAD/NAD(P)-binding domain-containing protein [Alternaria alternata]